MKIRMIAACIAALLSVAALPGVAADWPQFRGPGADNISHERHTPIKWSGTQNVSWKVRLPGPSNSSPIIHGERLYITQSVDDGARRMVMCFDRNDGRLIWQSAVEFSGEEPTHKTNPYSSATPATDGERIYAWHGPAGLVAYTMDGKEAWRRDTAGIVHQWGHAASPVIFQDMLIQHVGPGPTAYLLAVNKKTGETIWQKDLPEATGEAKEFKGSWSTPVIIDNGGRPEMILSLPQYVAGFNPHTGQEYWRCRGLTDLVYTSPVVYQPESGEGVIVAMSGYGGSAMALRLPGADARGDITDTHRLWHHPKNQQRIGTGVPYRGNLYICDAPGIVRVYDIYKGDRLTEQRLAKETWGSTMLIGGRLYITDNVGTTHVLEPTPELKRIATNALEQPEVTKSTPAYSDGQVFIRTYDHLWCFGTRVK